jgi:LysM repeat protein
MRILLIISILNLLIRVISAQDASRYILDYQDVAVAEMIRTGIPASIKMAQAMLESNFGTSELARKAHNHFGIKCGGDWTGKDFHLEDDDYRHGKLVKSCFREFKSDFDSYIAHSDFLTDQRKSGRYGFLFQYNPTDYKSWAKGLSKAGYATDPKYADKLISLIEKYQLHELDKGGQPDFVAAKPSNGLGQTLVRYNNDVKYVLALEGDVLSDVAARYDISEKSIAKYNDHLYPDNEPLAKGTKIYLQPKRTKFHGKKKFHVIRSGEDLAFVSQEYGIRLSALEKRNQIGSLMIPLAGQKIYLKGKAPAPIKTVNPYELPEPVKPEPQAPPIPVAKTIDAPAGVKDETELVTERDDEQEPAPISEQHLVNKGDTLFSISRLYGVTIDELKKKNNLSVDTIQVGQKLLIR